MTPAPVSTGQIPVAPPVPQFDDEEQARLIDLAVPIMKKVIEYLIDRFPMFAQLLLERLRIRVDFTCYAAWTNGVVIAYNPHWVVSHTALEVAFLIAHEIMHNLMCHTIRRKGRNPKLWNVAGDYCINSILAQYQVGTPPGDAVIDVAKYDGNKYLTEQVYDMLLKAMPPPPPPPPPGEGEGTCEGSNPGSNNDLEDGEGETQGTGISDLSGEVGETIEERAEKHYSDEIQRAHKFGEVRDYEGQATNDETEAGDNQPQPTGMSEIPLPEMPYNEDDLQDLWEQAETRAAMSTKDRGFGSMELHSKLQKTRASQLDWKELFRDFMKHCDRTKRSFTRIDPRLIN